MRAERRKFKRQLTLKKNLKILLFAAVFLLFVAVTGLTVILYGGKLIVDEADLILDETTIIETEDGQAIGKLYNENRVYTEIDNIPEQLQKAFVAIEDRRFYEHSGIDYRSVVRAVYKDIIAMSKVEGASTITQQLAKNLFLSNEKTWTRKGKEVMAALYMERNLTKQEIMELYLNEVYFGNGLYGVETASNYYFSKSVGELTLSESALLAGMVKGPNGYSPVNYPEKALERRNLVLKSLETMGYISAEERAEAEANPLGLSIQEREETPWTASYIDLVMKEAADRYNLSVDELTRGGYRIVVHMDVDAQKAAYSEFQKEEFFPGSVEGVEGAFVMMEQETGHIAAALGGRDYQLGNLNRVTVQRQPGSTFKPIAVYGPALMMGEFDPYTLLPDTENNSYSVSNSNDEYAGMATMYDAIVTSKNTSAVWLLDYMGIDYAKGYLEDLGMPIEDDGLSIALGGLTTGVTPMQMAESYRTFANGGEWIRSSTIAAIYDRDDELIAEEEEQQTEVFNDQVAWHMTEMLRETVLSGTASAGEYSKALAGKTGSTEHPHAEGYTKDAWFVGYTPEYVTATWMGYDKSDAEHYLTGGSAYPTRLTKSILTEVDRQNGGALAASFEKPDGVAALDKRITLPEVTELEASYQFGGFSLVKGKLSWKGSDDERVIYRIYQDVEGIDKRIGEVEGKTEYTIDNALFQKNRYYVVPYDPLTKLEGKRSNIVELDW